MQCLNWEQTDFIIYVGFDARLSNEIGAEIGPETVIRTYSPQDRNTSAWKGGAVIASLSAFKNICITRQQYEEQGPDCFMEQHLQNIFDFRLRYEQ